MGMFGRFRKRSGAQVIQVSEEDGVRALYLGSRTVQSAMRIARPDDLELAYSRSMMGFLLFKPEPSHVLMIGLGGGSLAKFIHRHLRQTRISAVEINPEVVLVARTHFCLPPDDERLSVIVDDGARYVRAHPECADVILVDGFDGLAHAPELVSEDFYGACSEALTPDGILAVNLWGNARDFDVHLQRIEACFAGLVLSLPVERDGNVIALAFRQSQGNPVWEGLRARALSSGAVLGLDLASICTQSI